jgi:hypothetical protein
MNQTAEINVKNLAEVGEDIGLVEGARLVKAFQVANPDATQSYYIGRKIIEQILAQPDCVGINFRKCLTDDNREHLVYTGIDSDGRDILEFSVVTADGNLSKKEGIVADRVGSVPADTLDEMLKKILGG